MFTNISDSMLLSLFFTSTQSVIDSFHGYGIAYKSKVETGVAMILVQAVFAKTLKLVLKSWSFIVVTVTITRLNSQLPCTLIRKYYQNFIVQMSAIGLKNLSCFNFS